ncbi:MAG: YegS/Rv2252/BmrU family lipid kinase [Nocardioidaceae bacterium]|nr:YegS/Rv2252/BmrU family lipid kinase [Nocardioidaceae bacterium]
MVQPSRILVIANAGAGTADEQALDAAVAILREHAEVEVRETSGPDELAAALTGSPDDERIVIAGGDGSIHAAVAALHRLDQLRGQEIGLIPLGTGNDFARTLEIPLDPRAAAGVAATGRAQPVDLVVDDHGQVTVNSVHLGAGAQAGKKGARWKERLGAIGLGKVNLGKLGYPIGAVLTALDPPSLRLRVEVDGRLVLDEDEPALMVAVGNGSSTGGGTRLTPAAQPHDGKADILVATPGSHVARLGYALRLPFGSHSQRGDVQMLRGETIRVSGDEFELNSDGEIDGPVRSRTWKVLPSAYSMVVPEA